MDQELIHLIATSGLKKSYIAARFDISLTYLSMLISGKRDAASTREAIKLFLIEIIKLNMKIAA